MIDMDAPEHRRRRRLVSAGFTPQAVRDRESRIRQVCDEIIDRVCEKGACDLVADIAAPLPLVMIADMLGFDPKDWEQLLEWSDTMLMSQGSNDPDAITKATTAFVEWDTYVRELIEQRRKAMSADDLLGVLVQGEVDGDKLDDDSIVHEAILLLIGGDETSRHVISGGMEALLRRPEQFDDLRARPGAVAGHGRRDVALGDAHQELPAPDHPRRGAPRRDHRAGAERPASVSLGQSRRDGVRRSRVLRHPAAAQRPHRLRLRGPSLSGPPPGPGRDHRDDATASSTACPTSTWPATTPTRCGSRTSSWGSRPCRWSSRPRPPSGARALGGVRPRPPRRPGRRSAGPPRRTRSSCRARPGGRAGSGRAGPTTWPTK